MTRLQAIELISLELQKLSGLSIYDLPDSTTLCNGLDDMEGMPKEDILRIAHETALEMLYDEGWSETESVLGA